jgi:hypothetical protein
MRITAVYDADGTILAAVVTGPDYAGPVPVPADGAELGEFDVPDPAAEMRLDEICSGFRVDRSDKRLVERCTDSTSELSRRPPAG